MQTELSTTSNATSISAKVHAVAYKGYGNTRSRIEPLHIGSLAFGQQVAVCLPNTQLCSKGINNLLFVAGKYLDIIYF